MALRCLTAGRMTMTATLLHQNNPTGSIAESIDLDKYGEWVSNQDPLTGEIVRVWKEHSRFPGLDGLPGTEDDVTVNRKIPCIARGVVDGGVRGSGSTESFGEKYENVDYVRLWVPPTVRISKRDRVTNISDARGRIMWKDEEYSDPFDPNDVPRATVFDVNGVTPLFDAFNNLREQYVTLGRSEVHSAQ